MIDTNYQTPPEVATYMLNLLPGHVKTILEPTPGLHTIVNLATKRGLQVTAPGNYFELDPGLRFDAVVMNPPFSSKYAFGVPLEYQRTGMKLGYQILTDCMRKADLVIALMPWFTISDSDVRLRALKDYGLKSVTALPRKTFEFVRIQTMVLELERGHPGDTVFHVFDRLTPTTQTSIEGL